MTVHAEKISSTKPIPSNQRSTRYLVFMIEKVTLDRPADGACRHSADTGAPANGAPNGNLTLSRRVRLFAETGPALTPVLIPRFDTLIENGPSLTRFRDPQPMTHVLPVSA